MKNNKLKYMILSLKVLQVELYLALIGHNRHTYFQTSDELQILSGVS